MQKERLRTIFSTVMLTEGVLQRPPSGTLPQPQCWWRRPPALPPLPDLTCCTHPTSPAGEGQSPGRIGHLRYSALPAKACWQCTSPAGVHPSCCCASCLQAVQRRLACAQVPLAVWVARVWLWLRMHGCSCKLPGQLLIAGASRAMLPFSPANQHVLLGRTARHSAGCRTQAVWPPLQQSSIAALLEGTCVQHGVGRAQSTDVAVG